MNIFSIIGTTLIFSLFIVMFIFVVLLINSEGGDKIISPLTNFSRDLGTETNLSVNMMNHFENNEQRYNNFNLRLDIMFLLLLLLTISSTITAAIISREAGTFSFLGYLVMGLAFVIFILGYINTIQEWLVFNLLIQASSLNLALYPIMNFYFKNTLLIHFIWATSLIIINKFNFDLLFRRQGRTEP